MRARNSTIPIVRAHPRRGETARVRSIDQNVQSTLATLKAAQANLSKALTWCPHCRGTGVQFYAITGQPTPCASCNGTRCATLEFASRYNNPGRK